MQIETNTRTSKHEMIMKIKDKFVRCFVNTPHPQPDGFTLDQLAIMDISCTF